MALSTRKKLLLGMMVVLIISVPVTLSLLKQQQESRSRASGSTTLSFQPASTSSSPIQKHVGDSIPLVIQVDPGNNLVTFVRIQVQYDPAKLQLDQTNPITLNNAAFPTKVEGPVLGTGSFAESVDVGADPTKAIQKATAVGTLNFKAIASTDGTPTTVSYGTLTQALSSGPSDQAAENVLSSTTPAAITIDGGTVTGSPTANPSGPVETPTPQPTPVTTLVSFTVLLHGVGAAGDNPNPAGNSLSNKNPLHPQRNLAVQLFNSSNNLIASAPASIVYDSVNGVFLGVLDLGPTFQTGNYVIKVKSDRYLRKLVPGIQKIENLKNNQIPVTALVAGDVNGDNILNVLDYNALLDCGFGALNPLPMADQNSLYNSQACRVHTPTENNDVDDNGTVNSFDYNLFLRELSVQNGD